MFTTPPSWGYLVRNERNGRYPVGCKSRQLSEGMMFDGKIMSVPFLLLIECSGCGVSVDIEIDKLKAHLARSQHTLKGHTNGNDTENGRPFVTEDGGAYLQKIPVTRMFRERW
jgi:hypothetical protein